MWRAAASVITAAMVAATPAAQSQFTLIGDWDANVARSKTAAEMRANVLQQYPGLGMEFTLNDRVATYFPARPAGAQ